MVSGVEGVAKPDPAIFRLLLDRYELSPAPPPSSSTTRRPTSHAAADRAHGAVFPDRRDLRADLRRLGLLDGAGSG